MGDTLLFLIINLEFSRFVQHQHSLVDYASNVYLLLAWDKQMKWENLKSCKRNKIVYHIISRVIICREKIRFSSDTKLIRSQPSYKANDTLGCELFWSLLTVY